jgi:Arc/MetJ-type ribon-helix-helix transcriptional regulator
MPIRDASDLPEDIARIARAQVSAGRFSSVDDVLRAGLEALEQRDATDAERARLLSVAWDEGQESLRCHGQQLTTESEFTAFLDDCVNEPSRL